MAHRNAGVTIETIISWLMRVEEEGERATVPLPEPVNPFPEFVGHLARSLKSICATMGKVRIAHVLARAGLHLGATTARRMLKDGGSLDEADDVALSEENRDAMVASRVVTAEYADHVWHIDLTVMPGESSHVLDGQWLRRRFA